MAKASSNRFLQDDKFFSRLLSREKYSSSKQGEASFRVFYYGGATGSVPFLWESRPGTPKHTFNDDPLPPLTPPPSYQFSPRASPQQRKKHSKNSSKILNSFFPGVPSKKINASPPSFSSPPQSNSLPSTPLRKNNFGGRSRRGAARLGLDEDEYEVGTNSPTSTLCFGPRNDGSLRSRRFGGVKKVVLSIVGHGTMGN